MSGAERPVITVCGLGPGGQGDLTEASVAAIDNNGRRFVRTTRHPTVGRVGDAVSFDHVYDEADEIADVYRTIADELIDAAIADAGSSTPAGVVYVVPGSPLVLERSVARLRADDRVEVNLVPSLSFLDVAWARLGIDPIESRVRLVDGHTFATDAAGEVGPLLVAHAHADWVLSDIKLAIDAGPEMVAIVLQGLGTPDERIVEVPWPELDQAVEADHLTSLYLPEVTAPVARELQRSIELMARLRRECPWDAEQTHESLRPYLIEEAYEVVEAIDGLVELDDDVSLDAYVDLEEELGDLWFQILFHSQLATEQGAFGLDDVARTLHDKLASRHPHVFGEVEANDATAVAKNWEQLKQHEKGRGSVMDGIPSALPALLLAKKVLTKADRTGVAANDDWLAGHVVGDPSTDEAALGAQLLAIVEQARRHGLDAETALREATLAARARFVAAESTASLTDRWILG